MFIDIIGMNWFECHIWEIVFLAEGTNISNEALLVLVSDVVHEDSMESAGLLLVYLPRVVLDLHAVHPRFQVEIVNFK